MHVSYNMEKQIPDVSKHIPNTQQSFIGIF